MFRIQWMRSNFWRLRHHNAGSWSIFTAAGWRKAPFDNGWDAHESHRKSRHAKTQPHPTTDGELFDSQMCWSPRSPGSPGQSKVPPISSPSKSRSGKTWSSAPRYMDRQRQYPSVSHCFQVHIKLTSCPLTGPQLQYLFTMVTGCYMLLPKSHSSHGRLSTSYPIRRTWVSQIHHVGSQGHEDTTIYGWLENSSKIPNGWF